ncbi:diacylglycerol/lipid kinase family protein [Haladaptatus halobius]|uniref:diacylglycerol/lipid kinase family protein n=1 Tax=Haladaptatus halobius TaxID=2884875 RepID=UPI001D0A7482|nr:diacylglycerol kinase family protein [Haladaptatus halobius]
MKDDKSFQNGVNVSETHSHDDGNEWWIILNPASGSADHAAEVRSRAADRGYIIRETEEEGDAVALAKEAADKDAELVAACGGDGTIHQVVYGLTQADSLTDVTFAVIPGGTGNNFAQNIGVMNIEHAFELLGAGERRRIDLGIADGEPFTNSCIAGLTAKTSAETSSDLKKRFGTLAYVISGLQQAADFDPLHVEIDAQEMSETNPATWTGDALCILIGNARRFTGGGGQANVEDGLFEITIVEEMPTNDLLTEAATQRLFGQETEHVTQLTTEQLEITSQQDKDIEFSLDGEIRTHQQLSLSVRPQELEVIVGTKYCPEPTDN